MILPLAARRRRRSDIMVPDPLATLLAAVPDPMLALDGDGRITQANPAALAMFGSWIIGRSHIAALRQPALLAQIDAVLNGKESAESRYSSHDPAGDTLSRVHITGQTPGAILHFSDISHIGEAEGLRRDFVANVSHELRTPLTALMGFIETLQGAARDDAEARARFLKIMQAEAARMNRLVADLLSLSQVESNQRQRPGETVDLRGVLEAACAGLKLTARENGATLTITGLDGPVPLPGDTDQLTQVFVNLIENALKYGGAGQPVTLHVSHHPGASRALGPMLQVDVIDQGDGIDAAHLPRLTERFYRVDEHRSRAMGGTGLGLAIVKHILNRHRGQLKIRSTPGQGSIFSVLLPKG
jgi:two-component system, OmpR family, phosphate regulon sensor histidine kinase PhoR